MTSLFSDPSNKVLFFDSSDTAQAVCDGILGVQVYNALSMRDSTVGYKIGTGVAGLAVANWAYNTLLRDVVQTVVHPGQAVVDALTGKGSLPQDMLAAGVGYGGYKAGSAAYSRMQGSIEEEDAVVEPEEAEESTGEVIEGVFETVGEGVVDVLPEIAEVAVFM